MDAEPDAHSLFATWEAHLAEPKPREAAWYRDLARRAIDQGIASLGHEVAQRGRDAHPDDTLLAFLDTLALSRGGSLGLAAAQAEALLARLPEGDKALRVEAFSLAGGISKRRMANAADAAERQRLAEQSAQMYQRAFDFDRSYFPAVNAATMWLLAGQPERSRELAKQTLWLCRAAPAGGDDYWRRATLGEAHVLLGQFDEAARWYGEAVQAAGRRYGQLASTKAQLRLIAPELKVPESLHAVLKMPAVVAFSGHILDDLTRKQGRFPAHLEAEVAAAIAAQLESLGAGFGYSSGACGADVLFAEALLKRGGELHLVLPFATDDFIKTSVAGCGKSWVERFHAVLGAATTVTHATADGYLGDSWLFDYANRVIQGMAILRANQLAVRPSLLTVLDPGATGGVGGTGDAIRLWRGLGHDWTNIDPTGLK